MYFAAHNALYLYDTAALYEHFYGAHKILNYKIARAADVPDEDVGVEVTRARVHDKL
jgi:hypothetical protein